MSAFVGVIGGLSGAGGSDVLVGVEAIYVCLFSVDEAKAFSAVYFGFSDEAVGATEVLGGIVVCMEGVGAVG